MNDAPTDRTPFSLFVFLGLCIAAGVIAAPYVPERPATPQLPDLSDATIVEIRDSDGRTVLSGEFRSHIDPLGNEEKDAALTDGTGQQVVGEVEIDIPGPGAANPQQELEVDIIRVAPNGKFAVFIDDLEVLNFLSDDRGSIDIEIQGGMELTPR
jgi:hypothetical protein